MTRPSFARDSASHSSRRALASIPAEGSSRTTSLGWPTSASATESRLRYPPDSVRTCLS
eukprot:CAMPEP_0180410610 /NCGR_PEP_ID=MMETSP0989-20121125/43516_1 /TAXON_ID=697907 /ORGANISM="non described non described, Strain CCMP2293" /LENGTH=58 /DNA_ID=CAMNT_0022414855 /DNA_START=36 /DNA_END=208 /DNA_ORIENTATION=-